MPAPNLQRFSRPRYPGRNLQINRQITCAALALARIGGLCFLYAASPTLTPSTSIQPGMKRLLHASRWNVYEVGCLSFGALAAGRIGVSIYGSNLEKFDICALVPVVEVAGGVITDWQGRSLTIESSGEIVASANRDLHQEVLKLLNNN